MVASDETETPRRASSVTLTILAPGGRVSPCWRSRLCAHKPSFEPPPPFSIMSAPRYQLSVYILEK